MTITSMSYDILKTEEGRRWVLDLIEDDAQLEEYQREWLIHGMQSRGQMLLHNMRSLEELFFNVLERLDGREQRAYQALIAKAKRFVASATDAWPFSSASVQDAIYASLQTRYVSDQDLLHLVKADERLVSNLYGIVSQRLRGPGSERLAAYLDADHGYFFVSRQAAVKHSDIVPELMEAFGGYPPEVVQLALIPQVEEGMLRLLIVGRDLFNQDLADRWEGIRDRILTFFEPYALHMAVQEHELLIDLASCYRDPSVLVQPHSLAREGSGAESPAFASPLASVQLGVNLHLRESCRLIELCQTVEKGTDLFLRRDDASRWFRVATVFDLMELQLQRGSQIQVSASGPAAAKMLEGAVLLLSGESDSSVKKVQNGTPAAAPSPRSSGGGASFPSTGSSGVQSFIPSFLALPALPTGVCGLPSGIIGSMPMMRMI